MRFKRDWLYWFLLPGVLLLIFSRWIPSETTVAATAAVAINSTADPNGIETVDQTTAVTINTAGDTRLPDNGSPGPALVAPCAADHLVQQQLKQILQQRKQQSYQLIQQLLQAGTKAVDVARIIQQLGGDMVLLAQQRADYPANPNTLIRFEQQSRAVPRAMKLQILQATQSQNYHDVFAALQFDPAPQQLSWHDQTLLTAILAADPMLSPITLQQLIDHGLQPVFADLVAATALQLPVSIVDTLNMAFTGDRQQLWFHQYRRNNLTLQAAVDGNVALYDYWLAQGVPAQISAADLNAFDLLPFPATDTELQARLPVIRSFIKQGLLPRQFTQLTSWLLLLPKDDALLLSQQLTTDPQNRPDKISPAHYNSPDIGSITRLSDVIIATNQLFKQHISQRHHCGQLNQLGTLLLSLDDANQHYGAALKASFNVNPAQIAATMQLMSLQQQLELLVEAQQWRPFIQQAQQQLVMLTPSERSHYILQQLLHFQAPAEIFTLQLQRHHRRFGVPSAELLTSILQSNNAELQVQLSRLAWWNKLQH